MFEFWKNFTHPIQLHNLSGCGYTISQIEKKNLIFTFGKIIGCKCFGKYSSENILYNLDTVSGN